MTKDRAELMAQENGEVYEDYSGRGMYGETTFGVTFESESAFATALAWTAFELGREGNDTAMEDLEGCGRIL